MAAMARPSARLIAALRETAQRLEQGDTVYRWSRFAHCNCGHLAQTITGLAPRAIEAAASHRPGDWGEQARTVATRALLDATADEGAFEPESSDVCNVTRRTMTEIVGALLAWGLEPVDVEALERLSDYAVRRRLGTSTIDYPHGERQNVVAYLRAWADLLEERLEREAPSDPRYLLAAE
jgi:hypothetical protein